MPIVHHTGGLADSVVDFNDSTEAHNTATGFKFYRSDSENLLHAVYKALNTYQTPEKWINLVKNGMNRDFSWSNSAHNYLSLYHKAIKSQ